MAIGLASIVSPSIASVIPSPLGPGGQAIRGPIFGRTETAGAPFDVLWDNGTRVTGVLASSLDEITAAVSTTLDSFVGRRVQVTTPSGQNNWGIGVCVAAYKRNGSEVLLIQNAAGEYFIEALASNCVAVQ